MMRCLRGEMRTKLSIQEGKSEKILELRKKGYSYDKIKKETGYGKGSISYHCGEGQKEKSRIRLRNKMEVLKEKFGDLSMVSESLKNLLFIVLQNLGKKGEAFFTQIIGENIK